MIIANQLPQSGINIVSIDPSSLFPFHAILCEKDPFYIHKDGSIFCLFSFQSIDIEFLSQIINNLPKKSSLQLYKLKIDSNVKYLGCVKAALDYSSINISLVNSLLRIFKGTDDIVDRLNSNSSKLCSFINNLISRFDSKIIPAYDNELFKYLIDCSYNNCQYYSNVDPKANVSVILTAANRCTGILSLNDFTNLDNSTNNILSKFNTYLQIISICAPSSEHSYDLEKYFSNITSLISFLSPEDNEFKNDIVRVHTIKSTIARKTIEDIKLGLFYINTSFVFNASSVKDLSEIVDNFSSTLQSHYIIPYIHSNSSYKQYISCFPGNGDIGYHYHLCYYNFAKLLIQRYFDL